MSADTVKISPSVGGVAGVGIECIGHGGFADSSRGPMQARMTGTGTPLIVLLQKFDDGI